MEKLNNNLSTFERDLRGVVIVSRDLRGWDWAELAAEVGAFTAAAIPLSDPSDEATAWEFAQDIHADTASAQEWVLEVASTSAELAIGFHSDCLAHSAELRVAQSAAQVEVHVQRADAAYTAACHYGRLAAFWNRVNFVLSRELEATR